MSLKKRVSIAVDKLPWYDVGKLDQQLVSQFTEEQIEDLQKTFTLFDKDCDGVITTPEVMTVLRSVGKDPDIKEIRGLIEEFDKNGDGCVEFSEFLELMLRIRQESHSDQDLVEVFRVLDQDGDGIISKADLREIVIRLKMTSELTNQELDEMIEEADKDGDGNVGFEEFVKIVMDRG